MHESLAKALTAKGLTAEADEETRRAQQLAPQIEAPMRPIPK